ncbi:putative histone deacetylase complex subunit cti6 [Smittium mucronatum]|uniref:Putative histone deacetylase complex subunit cti6 n=1 Tax=Smittium mucronatum TaxID=133383 RepID=A0A1R0GYS3_9FUNG|nr:putative histone deacetylase complex subunit cti6 [Smittium mucronatum]
MDINYGKSITPHFPKRISKRKIEKGLYRNRYSPDLSPSSTHTSKASLDSSKDRKNVGSNKPSKKKSHFPQDSSPDAPVADPEDGIVRCMCGLQNDGELMIQCEECHVWQHTLCVGIRDEKFIPDKYYCEICKEEDHPYINQRPRSMVLAREAELWGTVVTSGVRKAATAALSAISNLNNPGNRFKPKSSSESLSSSRNKFENSVNSDSLSPSDHLHSSSKSKSSKKRSPTANPIDSPPFPSDSLDLKLEIPYTSESNSESVSTKLKRPKFSSGSHAYLQTDIPPLLDSASSAQRAPTTLPDLYIVKDSPKESSEYDSHTPTDVPQTAFSFTSTEKSGYTSNSPNLSKKKSKRTRSSRSSYLSESSKSKRKSTSVPRFNYTSDESSIYDTLLNSKSSSLRLYTSSLRDKASANDPIKNNFKTPSTLNTPISLPSSKSEVLVESGKEIRKSRSRYRSNRFNPNSSFREFSENPQNNKTTSSSQKIVSVSATPNSPPINSTLSPSIKDKNAESPKKLSFDSISSDTPVSTNGNIIPPAEAISPNSASDIPSKTLHQNPSSTQSKPPISSALSEYIQWRNIQKLSNSSSHSNLVSSSSTNSNGHFPSSSSQPNNSIKIKFPSTRSSLLDMNKRSNIILEYINRKKSELLSEIDFFDKCAPFFEKNSSLIASNSTDSRDHPESNKSLADISNFILKDPTSTDPPHLNKHYCEHGFIFSSNDSALQGQSQFLMVPESLLQNPNSDIATPTSKKQIYSSLLNPNHHISKQKILNIKLKSCSNSIQSSPVNGSNNSAILSKISTPKLTINTNKPTSKLENINMFKNSNYIDSAPLLSCPNSIMRPEAGSILEPDNRNISSLIEQKVSANSNTEVCPVEISTDKSLSPSKSSTVSISQSEDRLHLNQQDCIVDSSLMDKINTKTIMVEDNLDHKSNIRSSDECGDSANLKNDPNSSIEKENSQKYYEGINNKESTFSPNSKLKTNLTRLSLVGSFSSSNLQKNPRLNFNSVPSTPIFNDSLYVDSLKTAKPISKETPSYPNIKIKYSKLSNLAKNTPTSKLELHISPNISPNHNSIGKPNINNEIKSSYNSSKTLRVAVDTTNSIEDHEIIDSKIFTPNTDIISTNRSHRKLDLGDDIESTEYSLGDNNQIDSKPKNANLSLDAIVIPPEKKVEVKINLEDSHDTQDLIKSKSANENINESSEFSGKDSEDIIEKRTNQINLECIHCHKNYINDLIAQIDRLSHFIEEFQTTCD